VSTNYLRKDVVYYCRVTVNSSRLMVTHASLLLPINLLKKSLLVQVHGIRRIN